MRVYELKAELKRIDDMEKVPVDCLCDYGATTYLGDTLWQVADNYIDIYDYDLLEWLKDNYSEFEDCIDEYGISSNEKFDLIKWIQMAQGRTIDNELRNNITEIVLYYIYNLLYDDNDDLTDEDIDIIESVARSFADAEVLPTEKEARDAIEEEREMRM